MNVKLLKDLNFSELICKTEAITEAGKDMLKNYRGYVYSNPVNCGLVNSFINEAQKFGFDTGVKSILDSVLSYVNENKISWQLGCACECVCNNNTQYGYIAKLGVEKVQKLLEMNESDVVSYIKAGSLKDIQYIPEFRNICKEVYKTTINETRTNQYVLTNPVSYVHVNENKEQYFSVLGKSYKMSEGKVEEAVCDNPTFARVNLLLESFQKSEDGVFYEMRGAHGDIAKFEINENGLTYSCGTINEKFETPVAFMEYANTVSKVMQMNEKMNWMKVTSAIAEVFEAIDNVVVLDGVNLMNCSNGTVCAIIEGKDNVNLTVFRSINAGTSCTNFDYVVEALNQVIKLTGIDLKSNYSARIDEDCKKNDPAAEAIKEQLEATKADQLNIRKKKIAQLAEAYKNDPARIALLNKVAQELSILENMNNK